MEPAPPEGGAHLHGAPFGGRGGTGSGGNAGSRAGVPRVLYRGSGPRRSAAHLEAREVSTGIHYPIPLHLQPAYANRGRVQGHFPRAEYACGHMLSLPLFPGITPEEVGYVCDCMTDYFGRR
ncbi:MAG TPA: hypothetical protein EYP62_01135 [Kiritimatiellae bacterium]|nr:hypothetical protein [Kiritimatiellia bacterium]